MDIRNFEVLVDTVDQNPHCIHGPTIIFKRNTGKMKDYYACSACRDKKFCNFYLPLNEKKKIIEKTSSFWKDKQKEIVSSIKKLKPYKKLLKILKTFKNDNSSYLKYSKKIGYCYTCNCLFEKEDYNEHMKCNVSLSLSYEQLTHPTSIIIPKTDEKTHAQYFFSESSVSDIFLLLIRLKITKILCIGVPRIHEFALNNDKNRIESILLDLDKNYYNFYSPKQFIWYNMFNNHIFDEEQKGVLNNFLQSGKIAVLIDPPFGGRVEPLARTLKELNKSFNDVKTKDCKSDSELQILWFFPYFMERHIKESLPNFNMLDYKVNYENHSSFTDTGNRKRKFGSPVRIFTNVSLNLFDLNGFPGYKFCKPCGYWVSVENEHCTECKSCTSKNGRTYVHCEKCSKCVKPSYKHCDTCSVCCLPDHTCGEFQPNQNCYHCHQPGHKKKDCLLLNTKKRTLKTAEVLKKKRKIN